MCKRPCVFTYKPVWICKDLTFKLFSANIYLLREFKEGFQPCNDIPSYYVLCTKAHAFLNTVNENCVKTLNSNRFHFRAKKPFIIKCRTDGFDGKKSYLSFIYQFNSVPSTSALKPESENCYFSVVIVSAKFACMLQGNYSNYYCMGH